MNAYFSNPFYPTETVEPEVVASPPVKIQIADIDHKGKINGQKYSLELGGYLRSKG